MRLVALSVFAGALALGLCPALPGAMVWIVPVAALVPFARRRGVRLALLVLAGFTWAWLHADAALRERLSSDLATVPVVLDGLVRGLPDCSPRLCRFILDVEASEPAGVAGRRVRLSWYDAAGAPSPGERWRVTAQLRGPRGFANPGPFDYEAWLFRQGIDATGYVRDSAVNGRLAGSRRHAWLDRLRTAIGESLVQTLGQREGTAVILALVTGDRRELTPAQWETLARTGTGHLMAISGLHIGLVAGAMFLVVGHLGRWAPPALGMVRRPGFAAACALSAATAYALLAGFTLPTRRALVMAGFVLTALTLRRPMALSHSLSGALLAATLLTPLSTMEPGFWLSFGAVAAIGLAFAGRPPTNSVAAFGRTQWAVTIGLAPIVAGLFGQVSVVSPVANALLIPLFSFVVVPLTLLGAVLNSLVPAVGNGLLWLAAGCVETAWIGLDAAASLPWAAVGIPGRPIGLLILAGVGAASLIGPIVPMSRIAALALLLPMLAWRPPGPPSGGFELALLDVGQGLAVVVTTRSHALLYDAGPSFRSGGDAARTVIVPYLEARLARGPDIIVISHGDSDHRGGAATATGRYPAARVIGEGVPGAQHCVDGQTWIWDTVRFEIIHPTSGLAASDNDRSCVLRITAGAVTALLPGDIEGFAEASLIADARDLRAQIVVVPHHGSATSSTAGFVTAVDARYALISAGYDNRWGHPKPDIVARWRSAGAGVLSTALSGAIIVRAAPDGTIERPYRHRADSRRLWTAPEEPLR